MFVPRETIYAALFAKFSALAGFVTVSRRLQHWDDVPPALQPALFIAQRSESVSYTPGLNPVYVMELDLYLYAHAGGTSTSVASSVMNPLVDAVLNAIKPDPVTNKQTLGGLVEYCLFEGRMQTDEGQLGDQAVTIIPISMKST